MIKDILLVTVSITSLISFAINIFNSGKTHDTGIDELRSSTNIKILELSKELTETKTIAKNNESDIQNLFYLSIYLLVRK